MAGVSDRLHVMANQTTEQIQFFLGIDEKSKKILSDEIKNEKSLISKYSKLLHLLVDRISTLSASEINFSRIISDSQEKVRLLVPGIPSDHNKFLKWVPTQMQKHIDTIQSFQQRVALSQQQIEQAMEHVRKQDEKLREREELQAQLQIEKSVNARIRSEHEDVLNELSDLQQRETKMHKKCKENEDEMSSMKYKLNEFTEIITKLRQQVSESKVDDTVKALRKENDELNTRILELQCENERLMMDLREKEETEARFLEQAEKFKKEKLANIAREKKFAELKAKLTKYGNELLMKERELNHFTESGDADESLRLQIKTLSSHLSAASNERDAAVSQLGALNSLKNENETLNSHVRLLTDELRLVRNELAKARAQIDASEAGRCQAKGLLSQRNVDLDSLSVRMNDLQLQLDNAKSELERVQKQNKDLVHSRVMAESELTKTKDALNSATQKVKSIEQNGVTLERHGFALADALCQHFNPRNVENELKRLVEVARDEHIQLSETGRVKLNPFGADFTTRPARHEPISITSQFDELENQIQALQMRT